MTIEVGNTGIKTITAIDWQYSFTRDVHGQDMPVIGKFCNSGLKLIPNQRSKTSSTGASLLGKVRDRLSTGFGPDHASQL